MDRKRFAIAVHYRQVADEDVSRVETAFGRVHERFDRLRKTGGKKVFELRPAIHWDKGRAIRWLLSELGLDRADVLPVYVGDDETDEDAFRALYGRGIGILVADRSQHSMAAYRLAGPGQVEALLRHLVETEKGKAADRMEG